MIVLAPTDGMRSHHLMKRVARGQTYIFFALLVSACSSFQLGPSSTPSPIDTTPSQGATNEIQFETATTGVEISPTLTVTPLTASPALLAVLPEGRVAFTSFFGDIFVVDSAGELVQITFDGQASIDRDPAWSPDGHWLAFVSVPQFHLRIVDPYHLADTPLQVEVEGEMPTWSPDGRAIIYLGPQGLMRMNVDGSDQTLLIDYDTLVSDEYAGASTLTYPQWSLDGQLLAFTQVLGSGCEHSIGLLDLRSYQYRELIHYGENPGWSPDGSRIVFDMCNEDYSNVDIWVMDIQGANVTRLMDNPGSDTRPVWSPSGQYIMFVSDRDGDFEIYIMDADGTNQFRLTQGGALSPAWGP